MPDIKTILAKNEKLAAADACLAAVSGAMALGGG